MSYIVKGGDIPKKCLYCPCCTEGQYGMDLICMYLRKTISIFHQGRLKDCPFIELPKQHGRLIDADYLVRVLQETIDNYPDNYNDGAAIEKMIVSACKKYIEHCPTIIAAEGLESVER